jgi:hypothetical protein
MRRDTDKKKIRLIARGVKRGKLYQMKHLMNIQGVGYDIGIHIQFRVTDDRLSRN